MRLSLISVIAATFFIVACISIVAARFSVTAIEDHSRTSVRDTLDGKGMVWAEVDAYGLQVFLAGTAPTEADRFKALSVAGSVVDAARLIDQMDIADAAVIAPPRFSVEILRNDAGISLIGLIPADTDRDALLADISKATDGAEIADFMEAADYPHPDTWAGALRYAVRSLKHLPRTKISVAADRVVITAMADSAEAKGQIESSLAKSVPQDVQLALAISAPRPVITPFSLRFLIDEDGARFDACSADTDEARVRILLAAREGGLQGQAECTIGLGVPSQQWAHAAELAIAAIGELGHGSVTFSDADISLLAAQGTPRRVFDDVIGELETSLPDVFVLHAVLPESLTDSAPVDPEFVATLSPEGLVHIRGRVGSKETRDTVDSFAKARFTSDAVHTTTRIAEGLPRNWPLRILTALETLSYLSNGAVTVTPDNLVVSGNTGRKEANAMIAGMLSEKLGEAEQFSIDVTYREALDPIASIPTPDECEERVAQMQINRKIGFEPGSATIDASGVQIMDDIADILKQCGEIRMEIGGHTDSQGREVMNEELSQARAQAILNELRQRRVLTSTITAKGYGESQPIADNKTEDGREANRRIEFRLIRQKAVAERETALESMEDPVEEGVPASSEEPQGAVDEQN